MSLNITYPYAYKRKRVYLHYAKSARWYLQTTLEFRIKYPWVYTSFQKHGYHTVRRSDRFWAGRWTDLYNIIGFNEKFKEWRGIVNRKRVSESTRVLWTNSIHRCASVHNAIFVLTCLQHVGLGQSRINFS